MYKRLILTHHKHQLIGDFLIDDRLKNGAAEFKGEHIHIFTEKYPTWQSVLDRLIPLNCIWIFLRVFGKFLNVYQLD